MEQKEVTSISAQLLSVVCHDLASPLMVITLNLEKLKSDLFNLKGYDFSPSVDSIDRSIHAVKKVNSILSLARDAHSLSLGKVRVEDNVVSIRQCFVSAIRSLETAAAFKKIEFNFLEWPTTDTTVTDENLFTHHILMNLLSNAVKFSYREGQILISLQKKSDCYMVYISDNGVGMPKEKVQTLFDFAATTTSPGTENELGTGYGLPIVKFFIDLIGAEIRVFSKQKSDASPYSGTLFELKVPFKTIDSSKP